MHIGQRSTSGGYGAENQAATMIFNRGQRRVT